VEVSAGEAIGHGGNAFYYKLGVDC
jgi:hypothetical protein